MAEGPESAEGFSEGLESVGYLPDESTSLVSFLATRLGKPVLVEGPAGVGKTQLAKSLAELLGRKLVRLQCYEGLDEAKSLYEWNYRKQLLRIQAEADGTGWTDVQDDIFGPEFLLERPLMTAIASEEPVVLLIDEIDKTDQEFEAMLLELLSDFQISVPELGRIEASTMPLVLLTSNNSRELTEALKRRCLYLWIDYPSLEHELEIVRLHAPELPERVARRLVEIVAMVRDLNLKRLVATGDDEIQTRLNAYEMAYRMQTSAPDLIDISGESKATLDLYGIKDANESSYARNCLLARRLVERVGFRVMPGVARRRLVHRGLRVDVWMADLLPDDLVPLDALLP